MGQMFAFEFEKSISLSMIWTKSLSSYVKGRGGHTYIGVQQRLKLVFMIIQQRP